MPAPRCSDIPVIVVDDDESFRTGLSENLLDDGHAVRTYAAPAEVPGALMREEVRVVVTDYQMAGTGGLAFADAFHDANPSVPIVLVTAYWTRDLEAEIQGRRFLRLCRKPVDYDKLHGLLHELVSGRDQQ